MPADERPTVYSSEWESAEPCPDCGKYPCVCRNTKSLPPSEQTAHIRREKKGRGGKTVTAISNLSLSGSDMKQLAKSLKKHCGTGGTFKQDSIELQGDFRDQAAAYLQKKGYRTKFTGG